MCKKNKRNQLYTYANLYKQGLLSEKLFKQYFSDYIITVVNNDISEYLGMLSKDKRDLNYAR